MSCTQKSLAVAWLREDAENGVDAMHLKDAEGLETFAQRSVIDSCCSR